MKIQKSPIDVVLSLSKIANWCLTVCGDSNSNISCGRGWSSNRADIHISRAQQEDWQIFTHTENHKIYAIHGMARKLRELVHTKRITGQSLILVFEKKELQQSVSQEAASTGGIEY